MRSPRLPMLPTNYICAFTRVHLVMFPTRSSWVARPLRAPYMWQLSINILLFRSVPPKTETRAILSPAQIWCLTLCG
jgi:hypothetical protein